MIIAHNLAAMNAQRQFNISGLSKKKSTEKLSSGYKINRAADDAAGLTISETLRSKIRALNQGSYNTQDGISWIQVADGAMAEAHDMMHRLKELAIHAANGTLTDADREAIDRETQGILDEIHRIDMSTEFNTKDVFLHGDVMFDVHGEPGDLEVYDAVIDENGVTFGGFLFHGKRVSFDDVAPNLTRMENGKQVFNVRDGGSDTFTYTDTETGEFFKIEVKDGAEVPDAKRIIDVKATAKDGIIIDGHKIDWSQTRDEDDNPVNPNNPKKGTFSVYYGNATLDITIGDGCSLRSADEFCDAINKANKMLENGGVGYTWITELNGVYSSDAMKVSPATFSGIPLPEVGNKTKRNVDNDMAYDSHTDIYDEDLTNGKIEYKLVAELVKTVENKLIHDDLTNGTDLATKGGKDEKTQDIRLYLVGADGKEVDGSSRLMSTLTNYPITDWTKGTDLSDGDSCGNDHNGHITSYYSSDDFVDKVFEYVDLNGKTDISMKFRLSEVVSADSIAYNVELLDSTNPDDKIQDHVKGLNGTIYSQEFESKFTDKMAASDVENKITLIENGKTTFDTTYDANIALGRNFDTASDTLAKINGITDGNEGRIVYDKDRQTISFAVMGNGKDGTDKTSSTYDKTRNINDVEFLRFNASTKAEEDEFVSNIVNRANKITNDKIDVILSGAASDKLLTLPTANETITISDKDENVFSESGLAGANRVYEYGYDYNDLMKTFNSGDTNTNDTGKKITIKMSDDYADYSVGTAVKDKYLKLNTDYKFYFESTSHAKDSYINAEDLTSDIGSIINKINNRIQESTYVYDDLNKEYVEQNNYGTIVKNAVATAKTGALLNGEEIIIDENGSLLKAKDIKDVKQHDYSTAISAVLSNISDVSKPYYETDSDGNIVLDDDNNPKLLTGNKLKIEVLNRIDNSELPMSSLLYNKFNAIDESEYITNADGIFDASTLIESKYSDHDSWADSLADDYIAGLKGKNYTAKADAVIDEFIKTLPETCSEELKNIIRENASFENIQGSFKMDTATLNKVINENTISQNAKNSAKKLGTGSAPAITDENLKNIYEKAYNSAIAALSINDKKTSDVITGIGFDGIKSGLTLKEGKISYSNSQVNDLKEKVVKTLTNGELRKIEAYYGEVTEADKVDGQIKRTGSNGNYKFAIDEVTKAVNPDAKTYTQDAMSDIVKASTYTLETAGYATTKMKTASDPGEIAYARYDSDLELEYLGKLNIQHSNDYNDYTEIEQFCFNTAIMKITNVDLSDQEKAKKAIAKIDYATAYISEKRSILGAKQNRLEHTYNNNRNKEENLTAAESRIRDTDMATEAMNNTKINILEQVMTSIMAQANQSTQGVLALLQ